MEKEEGTVHSRAQEVSVAHGFGKLRKLIRLECAKHRKSLRQRIIEWKKHLRLEISE